MVESGIFKCPNCGVNALFDEIYHIREWQRKGDKWIFLQVEYYEYEEDDGVYVWYDSKGSEGSVVYCSNKPDLEKAEECWKKTGGSTEKEMNHYHHNSWKCSNCKHEETTFTKFIPK